MLKKIIVNEYSKTARGFDFYVQQYTYNKFCFNNDARCRYTAMPFDDQPVDSYQYPQGWLAFVFRDPNYIYG